MNEFDELCRDLNSADVDQAARRLADIGDKAAVPELMRIFRFTTNDRLRDASVASLGELGAIEALPFVLELIRDPKTSGRRGSLVYALTYFDCRSHINDLAFLITDESFEVRQKTLMVLDAIEKPEVPSQLEESLDYINRYRYTNSISDEQMMDIDSFIEKLMIWIHSANTSTD